MIKGSYLRIVCRFFVLCGIVALGGCFLTGSHPSDEQLIQVFRENEEDFQKLISMAVEDVKVVRIAHDFTWLEDDASWPRPKSKLGFSEERWKEYRRLFKKLMIHGGLSRRSDHPDVIFLTSSAKGLVTGGSSKGYAFSTTELQPLYSSLDECPPDLPSLVPGYKPIKPGWYLYYEWDD